MYMMSQRRNFPTMTKQQMIESRSNSEEILWMRYHNGGRRQRRHLRSPVRAPWMTSQRVQSWEGAGVHEQQCASFRKKLRRNDPWTWKWWVGETLDPCSKDSDFQLFFVIFYVICIFEYLDIHDYRAGLGPAQLALQFQSRCLLEKTQS